MLNQTFLHFLNTKRINKFSISNFDFQSGWPDYLMGIPVPTKTIPITIVPPQQRQTIRLRGSKSPVSLYNADMTTQRVTPKVITEEESLNDVLHHVLYAIMTNFFYLSIFLFNFSSLFRHHPNCSCLISIWKLVTTCTCDASSRHDSECIEETGLVQER